MQEAIRYTVGRYTPQVHPSGPISVKCVIVPSGSLSYLSVSYSTPHFSLNQTSISGFFSIYSLIRSQRASGLAHGEVQFQ